MAHPIHSLPQQLDFATYTNPDNYLVNTGLVFKDLSDKKNPRIMPVNMNVLPAPYQPKSIPLLKLVPIPVSIAVVGMLTLIVMNMQAASADIVSVRSQIDTANHIIGEKHDQKTELTDSIAALKEQITQVENLRDKFITVLDGFITQSIRINDDFNEIVNCLTDNVSLTGINYDGSKFIIDVACPPKRSPVVMLDWN